MPDTRFNKLVVGVCGGVPLALLAWDGWHGQLGVNSVNYAIRTTGLLALIFLMLTLLVTPVRRLTGWVGVIQYRRALGLYAFFYACVHFGIYFWLDRQASVGSTIDEIITRRYLWFGTAGLLLMAPLAATSTDGMIRRLGGKRWKELHRLVYVAAAAGAIHYYMLVKADVRQPIAFGVTLAVLLLARAVWHYLDLRGRAKRAAVVPVARPLVSTGAGAGKAKFWSGQLRVARVFDETPTVRTFRLVSRDGGDLPFSYRPGQYLNLQLTVEGRPVKRSYTIASSPTRTAYCELTVKREEMGVSSGHLHRQVREGDLLTVAAPAGRFVFEGGADVEAGVVLIGGGVGITPLMSITRALLDRCWAGRVDLVFVTRQESDVIFREEIEFLRRRFPNFHPCIVLTSGSPEWAGERGRLDLGMLTRNVPDFARRPIYLCGPTGMMTATREMLVGAGVEEGRIHTEAFVSPGSTVATGTDAANVLPEEEAMGAVETGIGEPAAATAAVLTFVRSKKSVETPAGETVLEAAESVGVEIPFECRSGICGQCKTKLLSGVVRMDSEAALSVGEKRAGYVLACQARGMGAVVVDA